jgi:hypothetical protein
MDDESQVLKDVQRYVRSGFYSPDEIEQIVGQDVFNGAIDESRLRGIIAATFLEKEADEASWEDLTDCDRLDLAFRVLQAVGVIALHNAGNTLSDGRSDVVEAYYHSGGEASGVVGYCFYHGQDVDAALEGSRLHIAFGDIKGDDRRGTDIGAMVKQVLEQNGFEVKWSGSVRERLYVPRLKWRRRSLR